MMTDSVELRGIESTDAERMLHWMLNPEVADNIGLRAQPNLDRTREWIANTRANKDVHPWAIIHAGTHVGNVVLDRIDSYVQSARLSIYLGELSARGKGVAYTAVHLALERGFASGLERIWLTVHERNTRAALLYARLGFRLEGILRGEFLLRGERINALQMSILRSEFMTEAP